MILRSPWLLPCSGGLLLFALGVAALAAGDRLREARIEEQAQREASAIVSAVQARLLGVRQALASADYASDAALSGPDTVHWRYAAGELTASSARLAADPGLRQQILGVSPGGVRGPFTTATGRDLVLVAVRDGDGWRGATIPADTLIGRLPGSALDGATLTLRRDDGQAVFAAGGAAATSQLDFPVPDARWQLGFGSTAVVRAGELRWALYVIVLLLAYGFALLLHRLAVKPRSLLADLGRLQERFTALNRDHSRLLASREQVQDRVYQLSVTDAESGLPNRQAFSDDVEKMLARMRAAPETGQASVLVVGLRDLENAEQALGHSVVGAVFPQVAARLGEALAGQHAVARIGNYQLATLLPGHDGTQAVEVAARLANDTLAGIYEHAGGDINLIPRIGIAVAEDGYGYAERLIDDARSALTDAEGGQTRWSLFASENRDDRVTMLQLESDFRSAIENNEFRLFFQPIVHTHSGKPKGFECLVRWQHPVEGLLAPGRFIGLAESTGLITELTRWELKEAVRQAAAWPNLETLGCYLSINLSTLDLLYQPLARELAAMVGEAGLSPSTFRLEITESTLINNLAQSRDMLNQLRDAGFGVMMDDFGTGFSSLSYLRQLPFSAVKIDRSFTQAITWDSKDYGMVRNILSLVHFLEMESIIEGVETEEQHELLMPLDPVYCQGYLFAKPMPAIEAEEYLAAATVADPSLATGT